VVLLLPGELHCAWLGDVHVLLGSEHEDGTLHTQPLTYDGHRLDVRVPALQTLTPLMYPQPTRSSSACSWLSLCNNAS
jgi:hypothetical protein